MKKIIRLNLNENSFGPGQKTIAVLQEYTKTFFRYPEFESHSLKQAIAEHYRLPTEQILLSSGSGSYSLLCLISKRLTGQNDQIIFSEHGYTSYFFHRLVGDGMPGRKYAVIPRKNYRHDLMAMANAITPDTKLIFIENPDNPAGTWINSEELEHFLSIIPENVIVVSDEAYYEYAHHKLGKAYPDSIALQKKYSNLISLRTFSKAYGLAGLRVGYALLCPELGDVLNKARLIMSITTPALIAACSALKDQDHLQMTLKKNEAGMKYIENSFSELNIAYIPSAANFITFDAGENASLIFEKLMERNILISQLKGFDLPFQFLRVTVGLAEDNKTFIENLKIIMQDIEKK